MRKELEEKIEVTFTKLEAECVIQALRAIGLTTITTITDISEVSCDDVEKAVDTAEQKILNEW